MIEVWTTGTANGQRPLMMLEECGLPYRAHYVDRSRSEQRAPAFLAVNPVGAVPVLRDEAVTVTQSVAILLYLAEKCGILMPQGALPGSLAARAEAYECLLFAATDVAGAATALVVAEKRVPADEHSPWLVQFWHERMHRYLAECERRIAIHGHLAGAYSIADIVLFSTINRPDTLAFLHDEETYPALRAWRRTIAARPAIQRGIAACAP